MIDPSSLSSPVYQVYYPCDDEKINTIVADKAAETRISMQPIVGNMEMRRLVLGQRAKPTQLAGIFDGDTIVGVLGVTVRGSDFAVAPVRRFCAHFGVLPGLMRYLAYETIKRLYFGPELYVAAFWVDPSRRGGGLGQKLLAELRALAIDENMQIWTDVKIGNESAARFYAKQGFKPQKGFIFTSLLPRLMGYRRVYWDPRD